MTKTFNWLLDKDASNVLRVEEQILELLREGGYLKPVYYSKS